MNWSWLAYALGVITVPALLAIVLLVLSQTSGGGD